MVEGAKLEETVEAQRTGVLRYRAQLPNRSFTDLARRHWGFGGIRIASACTRAQPTGSAAVLAVRAAAIADLCVCYGDASETASPFSPRDRLSRTVPRLYFRFPLPAPPLPPPLPPFAPPPLPPPPALLAASCTIRDCLAATSRSTMRACFAPSSGNNFE